jgi:hypothetical protein
VCHVSFFCESHVTFYVKVTCEIAASQHTLAVSRVSEGRSIECKNEARLSCMCGPHGFMVNVRVGFGGIVAMVGGTWGPVVAELALRFAASEPPEAHVHGFHLLCDDSLLATPKAVVLSVCIGDLGCGQPISVRELRSGTISLAHM